MDTLKIAMAATIKMINKTAIYMEQNDDERCRHSHSGATTGNSGRKPSLTELHTQTIVPSLKFLSMSISLDL